MPTKSHNTQTSKTPKHSADSCINNIKEYSELVSRINFSKINVNCEQPDLLDIQKKSYENFLKNEIENVIAPYFPMSHAKNTKYEVVYKGINIEKPTKTEEQCRLDGSTYASSLFVNLELINNDTGEIIKAKAKKGAKNKGERGVFFADIPLMTTKGTFIINGTEKIVISQLVRSPGAYIYNATRINKSASS
jgi:DNA-directed RNA polymerase subunit beta